MKNKSSKLTLKRETLRTLQVQSLMQVVGGIISASVEENGCLTVQPTYARNEPKQ